MPYINQIDIFPTVDWLKESTFYQIFIDRFAKGDNLKKQSYIDMSWETCQHLKVLLVEI